MQLKCGYCKKMFTASRGQEKRSRHTARPKVGFACSYSCRAKISNSLRPKHLAPKARAYCQLRIAIKTGKIVRSQHCSKCHKNPGFDCLGRSLVHGHHLDYSKPLDVIWLCVDCHVAETPRPLGENNHKARLTKQKIKTIRKAYSRGVKGPALAKRYKVQHSTIYRVLNQQTWRGV